MDAKILILTFIFSVNSWAGNGVSDKCTSDSNYEYSACIGLKYIDVTRNLKALINQYDKLLSSSERELLAISNNAWDEYKVTFCKLENYSDVGSTGWQSNIDDCMLNKVRIRIVEIQKLIKYKNEDSEPL